MQPRTRRIQALALAQVVVSGCAGTPCAAPPASPVTIHSAASPQQASLDPNAGSEISCSAWHREPIPGTETVLINNVWNERWAEGAPHRQCLLRRGDAPAYRYGWSWDWPSYKPYFSYAAPEALYGWKAWDGGKSTTSALPRRIDQLESLKVDFAVDLSAEKTHNLNLTMWVTASGVTTVDPNPADIRNEVMVWFSNPGRLGGCITYDGEVTLGAFSFDVWHLTNHADAAGTANTWTMVLYVSKVDVSSASFDLKLVLDDLVGRGLVQPTHTVGGVELITEVFGGKGKLWLERFDVTARDAPAASRGAPRP
jgi:hypothetical protein